EVQRSLPRAVLAAALGNPNVKSADSARPVRSEVEAQLVVREGWTLLVERRVDCRAEVFRLGPGGEVRDGVRHKIPRNASIGLRFTCKEQSDRCRCSEH